MDESRAKSVGLGGDGDEIVAINDVERAFSVKLDYADASHWETAGDLYASLQKVLPDSELARADLWDEFTTALSGQTGVDPRSIERDSPLLSESRFWARLADASALVWIVGLFALIAAGLIAALR